jgi:hypothetical protein
MSRGYAGGDLPNPGRTDNVLLIVIVARFSALDEMKDEMFRVES